MLERWKHFQFEWVCPFWMKSLLSQLVWSCVKFCHNLKLIIERQITHTAPPLRLGIISQKASLLKSLLVRAYFIFIYFILFFLTSHQKVENSPTERLDFFFPFLPPLALVIPFWWNSLQDKYFRTLCRRLVDFCFDSIWNRTLIGGWKPKKGFSSSFVIFVGFKVN